MRLGKRIIRETSSETRDDGFFVALQVLDHTADISFVSWFRVCGLCTCLPEETVAA